MAEIKKLSWLCRNCTAEEGRCDCDAGHYSLISFDCDRCGTEVVTNGGRDVDCRRCGACYNGSGQRLRDDWRNNPSVYDDTVGDMEGYEIQHADW